MTLGALIILLSIFLLGIQFWRLRGISEYSYDFAQRYCKKHQLQFVSLARITTKLGVYRGKLDWRIRYVLEFSSDGQDAYSGTIESFGRRITSVELPVYKAPEGEILPMQGCATRPRAGFH